MTKGDPALPAADRRFALVDANSLLYRAFFALPPLATTAGEPTNAVYGFLTMLFRMWSDHAPDVVACAFDRGRPAFRIQAYPEYKAHRPPTPDDLRSQFPVAREALTALGMPILESEGYEADDVLATVARRLHGRGGRVLIVTGDRDALQLVDEDIRVLLTRRGISDTELYDLEAFRGRYGVEPPLLADIKGLMGDTSDNIPGVPGVGEKTAVKLVRRFGTVDRILDHLDEVGGKKLVERLREHAAQARVSKELAVLRDDVPLDVPPEDLKSDPPDPERVAALFRRLEFHTLLARVPGLPSATADGDAAAEGADRPGEAPEVEELKVSVQHLGEDIGPLLTAVSRRRPDGVRAGDEGAVGPVDPEAFTADDRPAKAVMETIEGALPVTWTLTGPDPRRGSLAGLAVAEADRVFWIQERRPPEWRSTLRALSGGRDSLPLLGHDLKPLLVALAACGADEARPGFDTAIAAYLLDPSRSGYNLSDLVRAYLGRDLEAGRGPDLFSEGEASEAAAAPLLRDLARALATELGDRRLLPLFAGVEMPLVQVLAAMELAGVGVDGRLLNELDAELSGRLAALETDIHRLCGVEFNINSPRQLGQVLFDRLGLPVQRRTKTGYSTDAEVLEALAPLHEAPAKVLEHRRIAKLKGTYVDGLRAKTDPRTGRIHSTFNQTVTATGRISSSEPNLQNIPIRTDLGRLLRRVFVPTWPDHVLLAADYSQIELRVLAHLSGDAGMQRAFVDGADIHARTAAEVFGTDPGRVTPEMRRRAKAVNFGIVYGISDFGLSRDLGIPQKEAADYIAGYFRRYPRVREYLDDTVETARRQGFVTTILGRRRHLPEIRSRNRALRQFAERTAMNTPVQGSAADIIKLAMVGVHRRLQAAGLGARLILQVHDELVFEAPRDELPRLRDLVRQEMESACPLDVPLVVDVKTGDNWLDMQPT